MNDQSNLPGRPTPPEPPETPRAPASKPDEQAGANDEIPFAKTPSVKPTEHAPDPKPNAKVLETVKPNTPAAKLENKCPNCGVVNRMGALLCDNCGANLTGSNAGIGTRNLSALPGTDRLPPLTRTTPLSDYAPPAAVPKPTPSATTSETAEARVIRGAGSSLFEDDMVLRLEIEGASTPLLVYPKRETLIGRRDPATGTMPDVDLTSYAGYRMGVSRRHAVIRLQDKRLDVYDLGSSNGTSVNGMRLNAHQPYTLRDGDEVSLGKMIMRVLFQSGTRRYKTNGDLDSRSE